MPFQGLAEEKTVYLLPSAYKQKKPCPGAGFSEGNGYGKRPEPGAGTPVPKERWQTLSSKAAEASAWNKRVQQLREKEAASIIRVVSPAIPRVCSACREIDPSKNCKLPEQGMESLCSLDTNRHRGRIIRPLIERLRHRPPYRGSLRQWLYELEKRNRPEKLWRKSTLPVLNRNDGVFVRIDVDEKGNPIRIYRDRDPMLVPEAAFSHDRTGSN